MFLKNHKYTNESHIKKPQNCISDVWKCRKMRKSTSINHMVLCIEHLFE